MGIAYVRLGGVMGAGAPTYLPPRASVTVNTTTSNTAASITVVNGDWLRVVASGSAIAVGINNVATAEPRDVVTSGSFIDIGPLKAGDVINLVDVT